MPIVFHFLRSATSPMTHFDDLPQYSLIVWENVIFHQFYLLVYHVNFNA